ncbi:hypothetical protein JCM11491_001265 [Sporobolomyces phaffii]
MFDFTLRTTTSNSASSPRAETLTPLPRKLSLRSDTTATITITPDAGDSQNPEVAETESLFPRPSGNFEGLAELGGTTFAELLGRGDMRESVVVRADEEYVDLAEGERVPATDREEDATILALPGGGWGVAGPDAQLLLQELHRARIATAQRRRRRTGYFAGLMSLLVFAFDLWLMVATIVSLARFGGAGRGVLRWIEFTCHLASLSLVAVIIAFLRTRRPSTLGMIAIVSATLVASVHVALAVANFVLAFIWKEQLSNDDRPWDIDVAWANLDASTSAQTRNDWKGWTIAAVVRFFLVVTIALVWLGTVRLYNRAIHTPFVISPDSLPSPELRALLSQHRASIIRLATSTHVASSHQHSPNWLPSHLDRAHYVQASEASAAYSYVSHHMRASSAAVEDGAGPGTKSAAATWFRAKVWEGVGWMFGVTPYEEPERTSVGDLEKNPVVAEVEMDRQPDVPEEVEDGTMTRQCQSQDRLSSDITSNADKAVPEDVDETHPATFLERVFASKRSSTGSTTPLLPALSGSFPSALEEEESAPPLPPKTSQHADRTSSSGSSGSTQGQIVYVRMSDGRLVRRLSTIASLDLSEGTEMSRRSRSDLSGSYQTGGSGPESFTTARSLATEQEVLLDEQTARR